MGINEAILAAVTPAVPDVAANQYRGNAQVYATFNYQENPYSFADDVPEVMRYDVQVHLFLPHGRDPRDLNRSIRQGLIEQEFSYPTVVNVSDSEGQHYVFECEYVEVYEDA